MNKQRKVLITITYNEMGIIIDTKAEEVTQPNLQPTCNQLAKDICVPCKDTISRQEAIDALAKFVPYAICDESTESYTNGLKDAYDLICQLPSAQPVEKDINVPCKDTISRQDAIDALDNIKIPRNASWYPYYQQALTAMSRLPSAYPETDSFCDGCKEYDQKRNFCPRFDRVIKRTLEEMGIIHCKDCRHWDKTWTNDWAKDYHYCPVVDGVRKASFYCADAERRPDEP